MRIHHLTLIGCGGTGSILVEPLVRLLRFHPQGTRYVVLADGDSFEEGNLERQLFPKSYIGLNKAETIKDRLDFAPEIRAIPQYLDQALLRVLLGRLPEWYQNEERLASPPKDFLPVIVTAVDNAATRREVYRFIDEMKWRNLVVIDPGNDIWTGQVTLYARMKGKDLTVHPFAMFPALLEPKDILPGQGCSIQVVSQPQLITANMMAATACLNIVMALLNNQPIWDAVYFDGKKQRMMPQGSPLKIGKKPTTEALVSSLTEV